MGKLILTFLATLIVYFAAAPSLAAPMPPAGSLTAESLEQAEAIAIKAMEASQAGDFLQAEVYWTQLIEEFPSNPALWSNRGNVRVGQNKLDEAIADYNRSIELAPEAADPYLNRGAAYEAQGMYREAIADYNQVLELAPNDAMAYNNRGNAQAGLQNWQSALADYHRAAELAPSFAFARANEALILYQLGRQQEAIKKMRDLVRKYPLFPDMRAALSAVLWQAGSQGEAESNWVAAVGMDGRYGDLDWVAKVRRWPPATIDALAKFLSLETNHN